MVHIQEWNIIVSKNVENKKGVDSLENDIKIREVNETDATKWFKFVNKVWRCAYKSIFPEEVFLEKEKNVEEKEKNFNEIIRNNNKNIALVAEYEGEIVGIMCGSINSNYKYFKMKYADLIGLYIDPDFQDSGIGSSLKNMFEDWARKNGATRYIIGVLKDNQKARMVYEKWGGKLSTHEEDFYKLGVAYKEIFYIYDLIDDIKYNNKNFNFAYRVSAIIYNADETKILLFYGDDMDFYMLPGGKVKEQEKSDDAIKREIFEELGYENLKFDFAGVSEELIAEKDNYIQEITITYKCQYMGNIEKESFKSKESDWINFKWVEISKLKEYNIHPSQILSIVNNSSNHIVEEKSK